MVIKKAFLIILSLCIILSFSGCSENKIPTENTPVSSENNEKPFAGTTLTLVTYKGSRGSQFHQFCELFKEKHGIEINTKIVPQHGAGRFLASSEASDISPDICYVYSDSQNIFPFLQPLDPIIPNLQNKYFDKSILEASKIDGASYLVNGYGSPENRVAFCLYNKQLFNEAGISTPKEFVEKGEWTLEKFAWCAEKISALGKDYIGSQLLLESASAVAGSSIYSFNNGQLKAGFSDSFCDVMSCFSNLRKSNFITLRSSYIYESKSGMALTNTNTLLRSTSAFGKGVKENIGITYLPKLNEQDEHILSADFGGFGILKSSKNTEAAALFLETYLQPKDEMLNYEGSLIDDFINTEIKDFYFNVLCNEDLKINYYINQDHFIRGSATEAKIVYDADHAWNNTEIKDVREHLNECKGYFEETAEEVNKKLKP